MHAINVHLLRPLADDQGRIQLDLLFSAFACLVPVDFASRVSGLARLLTLHRGGRRSLASKDEAPVVSRVPWSAAVDLLLLMRRLLFRADGAPQPALPRQPPESLSLPEFEELLLGQMPILVQLPELSIKLNAAEKEGAPQSLQQVAPPSVPKDAAGGLSRTTSAVAGRQAVRPKQ